MFITAPSGREGDQGKVLTRIPFPAYSRNHICVSVARTSCCLPPTFPSRIHGKAREKVYFGLMATHTKARPFSFVQFCFSLPVIQSEPWTHASRPNPQDFEHCLPFNCCSKQNVSEKNSLWVVIVLAWVWDAFSSYVKSFTESTYRKPFSECDYLTFHFRSKCFLAKQAKQKAYHLI